MLMLSRMNRNQRFMNFMFNVMGKFWKWLCLFFMGVASGVLLTVRIQGPRVRVENSIKKLKQRGEGNSLEVVQKSKQDLRRERRANRRAKR